MHAMFEEEPLCPECGDPLAGIKNYKDDETGNITIEFFCDGTGDDIFCFQILTGLTDKNIAELTETGKTIRKEMGIKLMARKSEEEALGELGSNKIG